MDGQRGKWQIAAARLVAWDFGVGFYLGHAKVGNGDKVLHSSKSARGSFHLLKHAIHRLNIGVAVAIEHAAQDGGQSVLECGGELLEWHKPATPRP